MRNSIRKISTGLLLVATLIASVGCSHTVPVLRGSEVVFRVRRSFHKPTLLYVELLAGQEERDIHLDGWYVSSAQMSIVFGKLGENDDE